MLLLALVSQTLAHRAMLYAAKVILRPLLSGSTADCMRCTQQLPVWCTPTNPGPLPLPACQTPRKYLSFCTKLLQHTNTAVTRCMQTVSLLQQHYTVLSGAFFWHAQVWFLNCRVLIFLSAATLHLKCGKQQITHHSIYSPTVLQHSWTLLSWIAFMWMIVLVAHQLWSLHQL